MTRNFHRWEVDPFFSAAEEVQDSADRLESVYRTWVHAKSSLATANDGNSIDFYRRELTTALGTSKWQLEEFERAVAHLATDGEHYGGDDTPSRHKQFVEAIRSQITSIETALLNSQDSRDVKALPTVNLAQEEKDDLAMFLCGSRVHLGNDVASVAKSSSASAIADRNSPCSSPESVESKISLTELSATSMLPNSMKAFNHSIKLDTPCQPTFLGNVDDQSVECFQRQSKTADTFIEISADQTDRAASDPAPEHSHTDDSDAFRVSAKRVNGHHRSTSVGSGLNSWKSGSVIRNIKRQLHGQVENDSSGSGFWRLLRKKQHTIQLRLSRSGFKRWKDGDADVGDQCELSRLVEGVVDFEKVNGSNWLGGNHWSGGGEQREAWAGALQTLQRSHHARPYSRPVQIASAILVTIGFVGLLSFHVTSSAI